MAQLVARVLWEHDVAGSNPVIPTIKGLLSLSDQESFSFPLRFQSSMFAFRKPNLVSPMANVAFRPKKQTLPLGEVCFFVGMTDRLGSVRLADAGSHTACGIYGAQRSIPCHFPLRFQSSMFAFRKPNLILPFGDYSILSKTFF